MAASGWWAAWWWRKEHWIGVDICTPPVRDADGWSYVDLELALARLADGTTASLRGRLADAGEPVDQAVEDAAGHQDAACDDNATAIEVRHGVPLQVSEPFRAA